MSDLNNEYSLFDEIKNLSKGLEKIENQEIVESNSHLKLRSIFS